MGLTASIIVCSIMKFVDICICLIHEYVLIVKFWCDIVLLCIITAQNLVKSRPKIPGGNKQSDIELETDESSHTQLRNLLESH